MKATVLAAARLTSSLHNRTQALTQCRDLQVSGCNVLIVTMVSSPVQRGVLSG